ncbi:hypothetical protein PCANB_000986 [Pneumocystis canis]|nr:hypothetical protein PCANB_000986 [Pneumocystis canis]
MKTPQTASPRRVLAELTSSQTNVLPLSFIKHRRTSSSDSSIEIFSQEESISDEQQKPIKESQVGLPYSNAKLILYDTINTSSSSTKYGGKYAHILKLRLRLAYYKLQINQPHSEFSTLPLYLIPKQTKKNSPMKTSKAIGSKIIIPDMQLPSPISSQTHETASVCSYNNDNSALNTFNYPKYSIGLSSPPLSEERYCKNNHFSSDFIKDLSSK